MRAHELPIARLAGVTETPAGTGPCVLVFHLETEHGDRIELSLGDILQALAFAERAGSMQPLPVDWWARGRHADGCGI